MSLSIIHSRACIGITAPAVTVETHISNGLPTFSIVGLPETVVKESRDRVRSALLNAQFEFPARRITVNLAPADLPKVGGCFDLPIALGILVATHQLPDIELDRYEFAGELALSGELRPIQGAIPFAIATHLASRVLVIPQQNAEEAGLAQQVTILPAQHLLEVCAHLTHTKRLTPYVEKTTTNTRPTELDLSDIHGQAHAKRALEIAAAGHHNILFVGPPGTGKTMLANRLPGLLPLLTDSEAIEVAAISSVSHHRFKPENFRKRPFRSPHHTASSVALVGGGSPPRPGEISLAHHGVLFLDELPEFNRKVLETLREPLESGSITISRAARTADFPARFLLVAAMNPCPCGHLGNPHRECRCTSEQVQRYRARLSGPFLDRIDMHIEVPAMNFSPRMTSTEISETSEHIRKRVLIARYKQYARSGKTNHLLIGKELETICQLTAKDTELLDNAMQKFKFSTRTYHRILRIARTIADLAEKQDIQTPHLMEALGYRCLD